MTEDRWGEMVARLDALAHARPRVYALRVGALAALGYVFLLGVLALICAAIAGLVLLAVVVAHLLVLIKFALPLVALGLVVLRALWVRLPPPDGIELDRSSARALFEEVDGVRKTLAAPRVHHVLLDGALNAGVVQIPRFGVVGQRNYLVVGLPLLQALTREQFRAVIAHELGHLSGNHGRFSGWIYRVRQTWARLLDQLEADEHWGAGLARAFLRWYAPYFNAYSFVLARANEYVADRASADAAGARTAGEALVRLELATWALDERYWPKVFEGAEQEPAPPAGAYAPMAAELAGALRDAEAGQVARVALTAQTGSLDTHPALADRLSALGFEPERFVDEVAADGGEGSAATALLGAAQHTVTERLDREWREAVTPGWRHHHEQARRARAAYEDLAQRDRNGGLEGDELVTYAELTERVRGLDEALPLLRRAVEARDDDAPAQFALGRALLAGGDEAGLRHLDRAMELDDEAIVPGAQIATLFLLERGRDEEAERYRSRAAARLDLEERARAERASVGTDSTFAAHELPDDALRHVEIALRRHYAEIVRAYLARKELVYLADEDPLFVIGIQLRRGARGDAGTIVQQLADDVQLPGSVHVISLYGKYRRLRARLRRVPDAEIYRA